MVFVWIVIIAIFIVGFTDAEGISNFRQEMRRFNERKRDAKKSRDARDSKEKIRGAIDITSAPIWDAKVFEAIKLRRSEDDRKTHV